MNTRKGDGDIVNQETDMNGVTNQFYLFNHFWVVFLLIGASGLLYDNGY